MSSFFIRRSVYFIYFGRLSSDTAMSTTRVYAPDLRVAQERVEIEQQAVREQAEQERIA